jgi:hypothetical protein
VTGNNEGSFDRRSFLRTPAAALAGALLPDALRAQSPAAGNDDLGLIPYLQRLDLTGNEFVLDDSVGIIAGERLGFVARDLASRLKEDFGVACRPATHRV